MGSKIVSIQKAKEHAKQLHNQGKTIVLVGGCFDILHLGHVRFLQEAGAYGDILFVMLESDETIKKIKGAEKPLNIQKDRAELLAALSVVGKVLLLSPLLTNQDYDGLVFTLRPAIIATTKGDTGFLHKARQAKQIGAQVVEVIERLPVFSSAALYKQISK